MYINQKSFLNMKQINKLLVILLALVTFSSCETYGDYENTRPFILYVANG